jgi:hypothetical protein
MICQHFFLSNSNSFIIITALKNEGKRKKRKAKERLNKKLASILISNEDYLILLSTCRASSFKAILFVKEVT